MKGEEGETLVIWRRGEAGGGASEQKRKSKHPGSKFSVLSRVNILSLSTRKHLKLAL